MQTSPLFTDLLLVMVIAAVVAFAFERARLPAILGFLLAGVALGPHGLRLLADPKQIHILAELGIILLMFTIGLEFSFDRLKGLLRVSVVAGALQLLLSGVIGIAFAGWKGWTPYQGFILGAVIALSSTAIVLNHLISRGELDTQHGRIAVAILIFQDLAVVPLLIFVSGMGAGPGSILAAAGGSALKAAALLGGVLAGARWGVPFLFRQIAHVRNRETFLLVAVVVCFGTAWISGQLGLSLAIGAFFAGLMFANDDAGQRIMREIMPLRYVFVSLFFVSIGLLFDAQFAWAHAGMILRVMGLVLAVNFLLMTVLIMALGYPPRIALAAGIMLSQIGEFSFLLLETGRRAGSIGPDLYHVLFSAAFLTMLLTPLLLALVPAALRLSAQAKSFGMPPMPLRRRDQKPAEEAPHIILCGFGRCGQDLADTLRREAVPFTLVEMN
ncbi:MAG: sodium:proton exchanger, partial [Candidatus Omnitrophica bacterium CG11_big_fil_rev_8_21_14_0_20_64_10]